MILQNKKNTLKMQRFDNVSTTFLLGRKQLSNFEVWLLLFLPITYQKHHAVYKNTEFKNLYKMVI